MHLLPDQCVDVAIADPPYNLSKGGKWKWDNSIRLPGFGGNWAKVMAEWDNIPLTEYFNFTLMWLTELNRVVRPTGSLWVHGTYHNIGIINMAMQLLGIEIINEVIWYKRNSFPNLSARRLTASHETILWAHTGGPKNRQYYFAYDVAKEMNFPEDHLKEKGKQLRTVWDIPNNKKRGEILFGKHPTQKPVRLLKRMLEISAREGDLLLVPFAGAGSDCIAAEELGMQFIAFETDLEYIDIFKKRLANTSQGMSLFSYDRDELHSPDSNTFHSPRKSKTIPPILKWTGSKRSQANEIASIMPKYQRYFEPFLGGGALLYLAAVPSSVASDIYEPLIRLWKLIQQEPERVVEDYKQKWITLQEELESLDLDTVKHKKGLPKYFYTLRERFNQSNDPLDLNFIMRTCVNGIVRFNANGEFNNSFHLSRRGMDPDKFREIVKSWHLIIQDIEFICQDYEKILEMAEKDDFVYLDPPYAGNRQRYIKDLDLSRFFTTLGALNQRGVNWALSFDGQRGAKNLIHDVPKWLYKRHLLLKSGNSAVRKVLNGSIEHVEESLYLNY